MPIKMIQIKDGVDFTPQLEMRKAIIYAAQLMRSYGRDFVITSCREGEHSIGSMHPYGFAFDFRSRELQTAQAEDVSRKLQTTVFTPNRRKTS